MKRGKQTYYLKLVKFPSEDFNAWDRTGEPPVWHIDDGNGLHEWTYGLTPETALLSWLHRSDKPLTVNANPTGHPVGIWTPAPPITGGNP